MKKLAVLGSLLIITAVCIAITKAERTPIAGISANINLTGNADSGYTYITTGDYITSGLSLDFYRLTFRNKNKKLLKRDKLNNKVGYDFNVVTAPNGQTIAVPNCLTCHAEVFDGKLIIGLGNTSKDYTSGQVYNSKFMQAAGLSFLKKINKQKYNALQTFSSRALIVDDQVFTKTLGSNPADRLTEVLIAHMNPDDFTWDDKPRTQINKQIIPTDVPAWWNVKYKNALYYNAVARGDFNKTAMLAALLTIRDSDDANKIYKHMPDVLSYIFSVEAPKYPKQINTQLAAGGKQVFINNCSHCHGDYEPVISYPNKLITEDVVGTDSFYNTANFNTPYVVNWFNKGWFGKANSKAQLVPSKAYVAPPLTGVWITAPYLHNGSVPTLQALLNSSLRPKYWQKKPVAKTYDYVNVGVVYSTRSSQKNKKTYNTTLPGYGNMGHNFGDALTDDERNAVIEYLKTL